MSSLILFAPAADAILDEDVGCETYVDPVIEKKISSASPGEKLEAIILFSNVKGEQKGSLSTLSFQEKEDSIRYRLQNINAITGEFSKERISELAESDDVEAIFYNHRVAAISIDNLEEVSPLTRSSTGSIGARDVWDELNFTGRNVTVAVLDTGIDYTHSALNNCTNISPECRIKDGWNFAYNNDNPRDFNGHGTHITGIIGANSSSVKGVAPEVEFFAVQVLEVNGEGDIADVVAGVDWSIGKGADIISMSLGSKKMPNNGVHPLDVFADYAVERGIVVSIAAGNAGTGSGTINIPASATRVISVGAVNDQNTNQTSDDFVGSFSSRGPPAFGRVKPEVVAPGVNILTTKVGGGTENAGYGTSLSCPHVSGAAALMLEADPSLRPADIRARLMHTAIGVVNEPNSVFDQGAGFINVSKAITQQLQATINGDDRWEVVIRPGDIGTATLSVTNLYNSTLRLSFSNSLFEGVKGYSSIHESSLFSPELVDVSGNSSSNSTLRFHAPTNISPGVYGSTLFIESNNSDSFSPIK
ncbi:S8 family serine peptidase [Candidatus Altiarchaeota archaeon]